MSLSRHQNARQNHHLKIGNTCFENVAQFRYLGMTITNENLIQEEIKRQVLEWLHNWQLLKKGSAPGVRQMWKSVNICHFTQELRHDACNQMCFYYYSDGSGCVHQCVHFGNFFSYSKEWNRRLLKILGGRSPLCEFICSSITLNWWPGTGHYSRLVQFTTMF
jgi:hypothetical protein